MKNLRKLSTAKSISREELRMINGGKGGCPSRQCYPQLFWDDGTGACVVSINGQHCHGVEVGETCCLH